MNLLAMRRSAGVAVLASLVGIWSATAMPALGDHQSNHETLAPALAIHNEASWWQNTYGPEVKGESDWSCTKVNNTQDVAGAYTPGSPPAGSSWRLIVVKAGNDHNDLYWDPIPGTGYAATGQGGGGWSHVILCSRPASSTSSTSTTEGSTSTTEETTTTTEPETTSTTTEPVTTSTTIEPEISASSTSSTSTTSTSTSSTTSTTIAPEVSSTTTSLLTTTTGDTPDTLPFTGVRSGDLTIVALVALATGSGLVLVSGSSREENDGHHI